MECDKLILKFTWRSKGPRISMTLLKKRNKVGGRVGGWGQCGTMGWQEGRGGGLCPTTCWTVSTAIVMKEEWYWCQDGQVNPTLPLISYVTWAKFLASLNIFFNPIWKFSFIASRLYMCYEKYIK